MAINSHIFFKKIFFNALDILFPNICLLCGKWIPPVYYDEDYYREGFFSLAPPVLLLCLECEKLLTQRNNLAHNLCAVCGRELKTDTYFETENIPITQDRDASHRAIIEDTHLYKITEPEIKVADSNTYHFNSGYAVGKKICRICHQDFLTGNRPYYKAARTALYYNETARHLIHRLKYSMAPQIGNYLSRYLVKSFKDFKEAQDVNCVMPVPLYWLRQLKRGYNQSEILAREFSKKTGVPCLTSNLKRRSPTPHQARLARDARLKNVEDVFVVSSPQEITGKKILLIDDVMTTGATFNGCARTLIHAGASEVYCLAIARKE